MLFRCARLVSLRRHFFAVLVLPPIDGASVMEDLGVAVVSKEEPHGRSKKRHL